MGQCPLCLEHRSLQDSHFIPKGFYKTLRDTDRKHVVVNPKGSERTSVQPKAFLLCSECEERFNKNGEGWTIAFGYRPGQFKLRDLLLHTNPTHRLKDGDLAFAAELVPRLKIDRLCYFAVSFFWRAAVFDWSAQYSDMETKLEFGPYAEQLRIYLMGGSFPEQAKLHIRVDASDDVIAAVVPPFGGRPRSFKASGFWYDFYIPGVHFRLILGRCLPAGMNTVCAMHAPERLIFLSPKVREHVLGHGLSLVHRIIDSGGRLDP